MINYRQCDPEDKKGMRGLMMIAHLNSINDHKLPAYLKIKAKGIYLEIDRKEVGEWEGEEEGEGKNVKTREDHLALTTSSGSVITTSGTSVPTTYGVGASNVPTINVPIPVPVTTTTSIPSNAVPTQQLNVQINPSQQINQQVVVLQ